MSDEVILHEVKEGVLTLTLNRPKANAFDSPMVALMQGFLKETTVTKSRAQTTYRKPEFAQVTNFLIKNNRTQSSVQRLF